MVAEMATATAGWEAVASVNFTHVAAHDDDCREANPGTVFVVRPWAGGGARAFFPSSASRTVWMDLAAYDNDPTRPRSVGTFRHELGHVLGLRHEHIRGRKNCTHEDEAWTALTQYERASVMHYVYEHCDGIPTGQYEITALDAEGASALYGPRPARRRVDAEYLGCRDGVIRFELRWPRIRGVAATRYDVDIKRGSAAWANLYDGPNQSMIYVGGDDRSDEVRVRACNAAGCSGYSRRSFRKTCEDVRL